MMNWPKVKVEARLSPLMTQVTRGLSEVCIRALPMPSRENEASMSGSVSPKRGMASDTSVTTSESSTVRLRPILFISMPVGTEKMRNQKNTSEGSVLATVSVSPRSALTKLEAMPTRSTKPMAK